RLRWPRHNPTQPPLLNRTQRCLRSVTKDEPCGALTPGSVSRLPDSERQYRSDRTSCKVSAIARLTNERPAWIARPEIAFFAGALQGARPADLTEPVHTAQCERRLGSDGRTNT